MPERNTPEPVEVAIVPHTHWDREWYAPFQVFRSRLVTLLDALLPLLESDLHYARFLLDGQTAVVDDYLAIRPEAESTLHRLGASGRLQMGPWMILMDEYMVSGETLVRDLQFGLARAAAFGGAMQVGYLPDMFGHVAQMPQILRLAGLEHAVVWRGVPSSVHHSAFWWEAPDGSRVRAEYLYGSYSNGRDLSDDAKDLVRRVQAYREELGDARLPGGGLLLMNGTDHQMPQPHLGHVVAEANAMQDEYDFVVTSLPEYLDHQPVDGLDVIRGELRSGARANVLMGVASNRVDTHQRAARAERAVERVAEPASTLFRTATGYPHALLTEAWRLLVLNSAHDSSCACSHDEVVEAVNVRYDEARRIAEESTRAALGALSASIDAPLGSTIVANTTARDRAGVVALHVPGTGTPRATVADGTRALVQAIRSTSGPTFSATIDGPDSWAFDLIRGPEFAGQRIARVEHGTDPDGTRVVQLHALGPRAEALDLTEGKEELLALAEAGETIRLELHPAPTQHVLVAVPHVAGYGWTTISFDADDRDSTGSDVPAAARVDPDGTLDNGLVRVTVDEETGTLSVASRDGVSIDGAHRLVDGGDGGDTYNYSPPAHDEIVDTPTRVQVETIESGPVRARARIVATYAWPTHAVGDARRCSTRSAQRTEATVTTTVDLLAGEPFVRIGIDLDNPARDHRLRAHVPLPAPVTGSDAECAFAVVRRGLDTEGGPHERALPTWVSRRFVDASNGEVGTALLHDGLLEYEVVEGPGGQELALTLFRAIGFLSRSEIEYRPNPAGPLLPVVGAQMRGPQHFDYAICPHRGDWRTADLPALADAFLTPFAITRGRPAADPVRSVEGQELRVTGAEVTALYRDEGGRVVRVVNLEDESRTVSIDDTNEPASGWVVDLLGRPRSTFTATLGLRPREIATVRLRDPR